MQYEIRIWNDVKKMPVVTPQKAAGRLEGMVSSITAKARSLTAGGNGKASNPDILIDKNSGGEDTVTSVDISYHMEEVEKVKGAGKKQVLAVKINIKGNLYLPLKEDGLTDAAKSMVGMAKDENKIRDTLLLSKWANVLPENDARDHFFRGVVISILTKAGDFRVITAKNVYIESYKENYKEGEFGTFELQLAERVDAWGQLKVEGLGYEEVPLLKSVGDKLEKAAKVVATVGTVAAGVGAVGKTITTTVEKFTGETAATRWIKYGFDTASSAGDVANNASNIVKNPKDVKTWTDGLSNINKDVNERIQKGVDAREDIPLEKMEAMYLSAIQKDPAKYEDYLKASQAKKYDMLKDASETMRDRAAITKDMEESTAKEKKLSAYEKEVANLEKEYMPLISRDPETLDKYQKASTEEKLKILNDAKSALTAMAVAYLPIIRKDPEAYREYLLANTDEQMKMLEEAKKIQDEKDKKAANSTPTTDTSTTPSTSTTAGKSDLGTRINDAANKKNGNS